MSSDNEQQGAAHPRVAVEVLQRDQHAILYDGDPERTPPLTPLTESFEDRRAVINWWQAAAVRTFGHLAEFFPAKDILRSSHVTSGLTGGDGDAEQYLRQRILEKMLEATEQSYRDLEVRANEWLADSNRRDRDSDDYTSINPTRQRHIAMRPAFSRLDAEQAHALHELWGGFEDREALSRWMHTLPSVADFSDIDQLDDPLPRIVARSGHAREMFTTAGSEAAAFRERFAASVLLPAMGDRARKLRAGERIDTEREERTVPHG